MLGWILRGLRTGVKTTRYPKAVPELSLVTVPVINNESLQPEDCLILEQACPTGALTCLVESGSRQLVLDYAKCISCSYCAAALPRVVTMSHVYELAARDLSDLRTIVVFEGANRGS